MDSFSVLWPFASFTGFSKDFEFSKGCSNVDSQQDKADEYELRFPGREHMEPNKTLLKFLHCTRKRMMLKVGDECER